MTAEQFAKQLTTDIKIRLDELFDQNFEQRSFFGQPWGKPHKQKKDSILNDTGALRNSINKGSIEGDKLIYTSSLPYASIHNEGGTITVSPAMKRYFWAMYYAASGKIKTKKTGEKSQSKSAQKLTAEAAYWKSLALMKVGSKMTIPERRFIGAHPKVDAAIEAVANDNLAELQEYIHSIFKKK